MIEMKVVGLSLDDATKAPILVLRREAGEELLPIWIGAMEAMAISIALNSVDVPRPLTHDLLLNTLRSLGAQLVAVDVVDLRDGTYFAELDILLNGSRTRVDCRPSDAIALALRADVPIFVSEDVLRRAAEDRLRPNMDENAARRPTDAASAMAREETARRDVRRRAGQPPWADGEAGSPINVEQISRVREAMEDQRAAKHKADQATDPSADQITNRPRDQHDLEEQLAELLRSLDPETKYRM
ncbi:bifunctional nuclease family protein [Nitratidesulfovibrio sp. SRB-5]|uniref:bifunctional nuclease family protein n=1 Tax=Nitratidesulfovibrio sp. SRB-5 TaxID=2872636 RepID=UPI0010252080|nr:bifunctional nuclease family protein [Nitratidesulfovibrio sp. SRB-5]MBZ2172512.1 bifunctional nuclease family protein [Nitratidesulfovibrio sp. SRB-5]RXF75273.1 bifunctional nuclease family protein [Desulfovibrio sp. DS-1]